MRLAFAFVLALAATSCTDDTAVDSSQWAIDTDSNGTFDCADLDHVNACLNHHIADACAHADVNSDGVVDAQDLHDISTALHDSGHTCTAH